MASDRVLRARGSRAERRPHVDIGGGGGGEGGGGMRGEERDEAEGLEGGGRGVMWWTRQWTRCQSALQ